MTVQFSRLLTLYGILLQFAFFFRFPFRMSFCISYIFVSILSLLVPILLFSSYIFYVFIAKILTFVVVPVTKWVSKSSLHFSIVEERCRLVSRPDSGMIFNFSGSAWCFLVEQRTDGGWFAPRRISQGSKAKTRHMNSRNVGPPKRRWQHIKCAYSHLFAWRVGACLLRQHEKASWQKSAPHALVFYFCLFLGKGVLSTKTRN